MFHFLVKYDGWAQTRDLMPQGRMFEYTHETIIEQFKPGGILNTDRITSLPALFVTETKSTGDQIARVGNIMRVQVATKDVNIEYSFDERIPPIPNSTLENLSLELDIGSFELSRTHWAIKNVDLFKVLLETQIAMLPSPKVFRLKNNEVVDNTLLSVMMPFDTRFNDVYATIQATAKDLNMRCMRDDDIWEDHAIIQDVVSLINRSRIIICDCTQRNANVFYEVGIAHTLGRDAILIAQAEADIPFDLRHLRYAIYLNNSEGRTELAERLQKRIQTLLEHPLRYS
jgi:hypothetical protein